MEFNVKLVLMATVLILGCISNGKSADSMVRVIGEGDRGVLHPHTFISQTITHSPAPEIVSKCKKST